MRIALAGILVLLAASGLFAITVEEIGRLSELKTNDDLMLEMIQKDGLDRPLTTADVIYLRERGTSEPVIQYCLRLSDSMKASRQPANQQGSEKISENLRAYTTTTKSGKQIRVVTNLDENGQRMGGPVPPSPPMPEEPAPSTYSSLLPPEIRVVVETPPAPELEPQPIPVYDGGISTYPLYPYSPYYPYPIPGTIYRRHPRTDQNTATWHENASRQRTRPQIQQRPSPPPAPAASRGTRRQ